MTPVQEDTCQFMVIYLYILAMYFFSYYHDRNHMANKTVRIDET